MWFHPDPAEAGFSPIAPFGDTSFLVWHKIKAFVYVLGTGLTVDWSSALISVIYIIAECLDTQALTFSPTQFNRSLKIICLYMKIHSCHIQYRNTLWVSHRQTLLHASLMFNRLVKFIKNNEQTNVTLNGSYSLYPSSNSIFWTVMISQYGPLTHCLHDLSNFIKTHFCEKIRVALK